MLRVVELRIGLALAFPTILAFGKFSRATFLSPFDSMK
jgi:hypothetical protein